MAPAGRHRAHCLLPHSVNIWISCFFCLLLLHMWLKHVWCSRSQGRAASTTRFVHFLRIVFYVWYTYFDGRKTKFCARVAADMLMKCDCECEWKTPLQHLSEQLLFIHSFIHFRVHVCVCLCGVVHMQQACKHATIILVMYCKCSHLRMHEIYDSNKKCCGCNTACTFVCKHAGTK